MPRGIKDNIKNFAKGQIERVYDETYLMSYIRRGDYVAAEREIRCSSPNVLGFVDKNGESALSLLCDFTAPIPGQIDASQRANGEKAKFELIFGLVQKNPDILKNFAYQGIKHPFYKLFNNLFNFYESSEKNDHYEELNLRGIRFYKYASSENIIIKAMLSKYR